LLVEKYTLQVILPEGVSNIDSTLPPELSDVRKSFDRYYSYLDFFGRPVLVFEKDNLLDYHNELKFTVGLFDFSSKKETGELQFRSCADDD
jgi:Ribophorin I